MADWGRRGAQFADVRSFLGEVYGADLHASRIGSLAGATLGVMQSASLAVAVIGQALARSPLRPLGNMLPSGARTRILQRTGRELKAVAVLAGPPAVSHAEALLRGVALRGVGLAGPLDTIVVPLPWVSLHDPREPLNPITAVATGLGHALRLWRDAWPLQHGGTVVLLHDLRRAFGHGPQAP